MELYKLFYLITIIFTTFFLTGCSDDPIKDVGNKKQLSDDNIRTISTDIITDEYFYESLPNFGIDFTDKESFVKHCLPKLAGKKLYEDRYDIKKILENGNVNFIFQYSSFPKYEISIPILWTGFSERYQSDNSWQFRFQSLDWLHYYTSQKIYRDPNPNLNLRLKHLIGGYVIKDYANNALEKPLEYAWNDHAIARRTDRTREYLDDYINYNDSLNISILYPALKLAYSHYLKLLLPDHYPILPHNHGLMMDVALYKAAIYFNFIYKKEAVNKSTDRMNWQIQNSLSSNGVHLEHSTGYQDFYLELLIDIAKSFLNSDLEIPEYIIHSIDNMFMAIPYLLQPNFTYPQFGDTPNYRTKISSRLEDYIKLNVTDTDLSYLIDFFNSPGINYNLFENTKIFDGAGYAAFRSNWSSHQPENDIVAHYSCNFFSWTHYHRSENTFELYGYGTEIIVDAGHYNFNSKDPYTDFSYQAYAHNVLLVNDESYQPNERYFGVSKIDDYKIVDTGLSWVRSYHPHYSHLNIEKVYRYFGMDDQSLIYLKDSLKSPNKTYSYQQLFTLRPEFQNVEKLQNNLILISSNNNDYPGLIIYPFFPSFDIGVRNGVKERQLIGWYFEKTNHKVPTNTIELEYRDLGEVVELPVIMEVLAPSEVDKVVANQDEYLEKFISRKDKFMF